MMGSNIKEIGSLGISKEREFIYSKTEIDMKEGGKKVKERGKANMCGLEVGSMLGSGPKGKCMGREFLLRRMGVLLREFLLMIRL